MQDSNASEIAFGKRCRTDMKRMLEEELFTDFTIIIKDFQFLVHTPILAVKSPVFETLFSTDLKEKKERQTVLHDIEPHVFEAMLKFVYYGNESDIEIMAEELFINADKYDIQDLKDLSRKMLFRVLNDDNVLRALDFAHTYDLTELKVRINSYLIRSLTIDNVLENLKLANDFKLFGLKESAIRYLIENIKDDKLAQKINLENFLAQNPKLAVEIIISKNVTRTRTIISVESFSRLPKRH